MRCRPDCSRIPGSRHGARSAQQPARAKGACQSHPNQQSYPREEGHGSSLDHQDRLGRFNYVLLRDCLANTMTIVGTIIWLILGAVAFVGLYDPIGGSDLMRDLLKSAGLGPLGTIFVMMAIPVILGTFMEWIAIIFITVPVFAAGLIWFMFALADGFA